MRRIPRFVVLALLVLVAACSSDDETPVGPTGPNVPQPDVEAIQRVAIVNDGFRQLSLRRGVTREVRVRALDAEGAPIPGAERFLRLQTGDIFVASTSRIDDDDPADGVRAFEVRSRAIGDTDLIATVEQGSPLLNDEIRLRVIPQGPEASLLPGTYRFEGELLRQEVTCPDAGEQLVVDEIEVTLDGEARIRATFEIGTVSGPYDPLEIAWLATGAGALDDGAAVTLRMEGTWFRRGTSIVLEDGLAIRRVDDDGETICTSSYFGDLTGRL